MDPHTRLVNAHAEISSRKRIATVQLPELWSSLYRHQTIDLDVSPAPSGLGKRQHVYGGGVMPPEVARASRLEEIWRICSIILIRRLWQSKHAPPFLQPVDPIALNILDYYNYVQRPMDLRTIKERIASMNYKTPFEFRDDVRQVGTMQRLMGSHLYTAFDIHILQTLWTLMSKDQIGGWLGPHVLSVRHDHCHHSHPPSGMAQLHFIQST